MGDAMRQVDNPGEIVVRRVRWRAVAVMTAYFVVTLPIVGLVGQWLSYLIHGSHGASPTLDLVPWLVGGLVSGFVAGLLTSGRDHRAIHLTATEIAVPRIWLPGSARLPRSEVDAGASARRGVLDVLLGRSVIRGRDGRSLSVYRWTYTDRDLGRLEAALGIPVTADGRGA
jgi:hypothetical protein